MSVIFKEKHDCKMCFTGRSLLFLQETKVTEHANEKFSDSTCVKEANGRLKIFFKDLANI